jgi:hypothetical protein
MMNISTNKKIQFKIENSIHIMLLGAKMKFYVRLRTVSSSAEIITLSAARQLVKCHGSEVTPQHYQSSSMMSHFTDV